MKLKLDIQQRLALLGLKPQKGDILTVRTAVEFDTAIGFDSAELEELNLRRLSDGRVQWNKEILFLTLPLEIYQSDLNKGIISARLLEEFRSSGISLSDDACLSPKPDGNWLISDADQTYNIKQEASGLNIYKAAGGSKEIEISTGARGIVKDALREQEKAGTLPVTETTLQLWEMFMETGPELVGKPEQSEKPEQEARC